MLRSIIGIKKEELNDVLDSLLINSSVNRFFIKYIMFMLITLLFIILFKFNYSLLLLFNSINLSLLGLEINPLLLLLISAIAFSNKNILTLKDNIIYRFYSDKYIFAFYYCKEKFYILVFTILIILLISLSYILKYISFNDLIFALVLLILTVSINVYYLYKIENNWLKVDLFKNYLEISDILTLTFFFILILLSTNYNIVPVYIIINIPLFIIISKLFIYSELIFIDPNYKQTFFQYKYLKIPIYKIFSRSILYTKNLIPYSIFIVLNLTYLLIINFSFIKIFIYILLSTIAFIVTVTFSYLITKIECFNNKRNYILYFIFIELSFLFIALNFILAGKY